MKEMRPVKGKIDLAEYLITSQALRIAPANEMFWYTSGTVGPYYINTHYLYGGPEKAEEMLSFINDEKENSDRFLLSASTVSSAVVADNVKFSSARS